MLDFNVRAFVPLGDKHCQRSLAAAYHLKYTCTFGQSDDLCGQIRSVALPSLKKKEFALKTSVSG